MTRTTTSNSWTRGAVGAVLVGLLVSAPGLGAMAAAPPPAAVPTGIGTVSPVAETVPVMGTGDAADDPAIWRNPADPAASLIIGNDKLGALDVYDLDGSRRQRITTGTSFWGNVDVRQDVQIAGRTHDVIATYNSGLRLFDVDRTTLRLIPTSEGAGAIDTGAGEGVCLYRSAVSGSLYAVVISIAGRVRQFQITDPDGDGLLSGELRREFQVGSEAEGCVADDITGALYISEEDVGLWRYSAEPTADTTRSLLDSVTPAGRIAPDAEGVTLVARPGAAGYVLVSAQNVAAPLSSYFVAYRRDTGSYVGAFRVVAGTNADGCSRTDGITVLAEDLGPSLPQGVFVCQDDQNTAPGTAGNQDFKLVPLEDVVALLEPTPSTQPPTARFTSRCPELTCTFDASGSTDDGTIQSYAWAFGDGTTATGVTVDHQYAAADAYPVTLTVVDDLGTPGALTRSVTVPDALQGPISFVAAARSNANSTTHRVTIPTSVQAGDGLLMVIAINTTSTINTPTGVTGWQSLGPAVTSGSSRAQAFWKVATSTDDGSTVSLGLSSQSKADMVVAAYRGTSTATVVGAFAGVAETVSRTTHTAPTVQVADPASWVVSYWSHKDGSSTSITPPAGVTARIGGSQSGSGRITGLLADSAARFPTGQYSAGAATAQAPSSNATMWSVILRAS